MLRPRALSCLLALVVAAAMLGACQSIALTVANAPALVGPFQRHADLVYGPDARQRLDVFVPERGSDRPVVVFWYGGSWTGGSKGSYRFVGAELARAGYVAVLPDYRLYPQVRFPEFVGDAARAVVWVHAHARDYGGDPERMFVMGHSAGAHQAAMLAFDPQQLARVGGDRHWIRGFIGLSGPYALVPNSDVLDTIFAAPYSPIDWQPVRHVDAAAPPSLIFQGLDDRVVDPAHARALDAALRAVAVPSELHLYAGRGHADTVAALSVPGRGRAPVLLEVQRFIERNGRSH